MSHSSHSHDHAHDTDNIQVAFWLNLGFSLIEIVGGIFTNSVAILSDAVHDLGDSVSLGLAWYFQRLSQKKGDKKFSFGYQRFSILGAVINAMVLLIGGIFVLQQAIPKLWSPGEPQAQGMMWLAILGIIVNGLAVVRLRKGASINEQVVSLHLLEDVLGWAAVLIASVAMQIWEVPILDPLLSVLITAWIFWNVFRNLRSSFRILLQGVPEGQNIVQLKQQIMDLTEVAEVHDIHLWTLEGNQNVFTVHLKVKSATQLPEVSTLKSDIRALLAESDIHHCTIEAEAMEEDCKQGEEQVIE